MNSNRQILLFFALFLSIVAVGGAHARSLSCHTVQIGFVANDAIYMQSESFLARNLEPDERSRSELIYSVENKYFANDRLQIAIPKTVYQKNNGEKLTVKIKRGSRQTTPDLESCTVRNVADILCYLTAREKNGMTYKFELQRKLSATTSEGYFTSVDGNAMDENYRRLFPSRYSNAIILASAVGSGKMKFRFDAGTKNGLPENIIAKPEDGLIGGTDRFTVSFNFVPWITSELRFGEARNFNEEKNLNRNATVAVNLSCKVN